MAYSRYKRRPRRTRRTPRRPARRQYRTKRTTYRKKRTMGTSRRRILNIASTKKRDNMRFYDPTAGSATSLSIDGRPQGSQSIFMFCATAREKDFAASGLPSERGASTVFWKGVSEAVSLTVATGVAWKWRRLVFSSKGLRENSTTIELSPGGWARPWNAYGDATTLSRLFQGTQGIDFNSYMLAKPNRDLMTIMYDKTRVLRSGNASPHEHHVKMWHGLNKTMYYDDDENGTVVPGVTNRWAAISNHGLGDVYIMDIFDCIDGVAADKITIRSHTTAYWHEK